jgi:aspartyl protease family protein
LLLDGVAVAAWLFFIFVLVAAFVTVGWLDSSDVLGLSGDASARLIALLAILGAATATLASFYRDRMNDAVKHMAVWAGLFLGVIGLYAYRTELTMVADRVMGELRPEGSQINVYGPNKAVRLKKAAWSNHFLAQASVGGTRVEMIVDTGASTVVLRHEDAKRLNIDMKALRYTVPVQTANGSSFAARVQLGNLFIGDVGLDKVEALVAKPGSLHQSLLGMSFLSRLRSYEFSKDFLELRG